MKFDAVILAGGASSRMGRDKAFLKIGGQPLLARQIRIAIEAGASQCFISGRTGVDYSSFSRPVLPDRFADAGPLAGIEAALATAAAPLMLVVAVDLPQITAPVLRQIVSGCAGGKGVIPRLGEKLEPLAAVYPKAAHSIAAAMLEQRLLAVRDFAANCVRLELAGFLDVPASEVCYFKNCNTPGDLAGQPG